MSNIREKLAIVFCGSVPMEKVNLFFFYQLGAQLSPLSKMTAEPKNRVDVFIAGQTVGTYVRSLLNWTVELKVCRAGATALLDAIDKVQKWSNTVKAPEDWTKKDYSLDSMFQQVIIKAKNLETVLSEELQTLSSYYASQKGIYSISDLIDQAEKMFFPSMLEKFGESVVQDIKQGGRCLAFDIPTACGFHMLRATEAVLHEYYISVCKPESKDKLSGWSAYISVLFKLSEEANVEPDIKAHVKKVIALLQQIKDQDRNLIMHPEVVLTADEAFVLFEITKGIIMAMSDRLPKVG
jgi:hypothetical protein